MTITFWYGCTALFTGTQVLAQLWTDRNASIPAPASGRIKLSIWKVNASSNVANATVTIQCFPRKEQQMPKLSNIARDPSTDRFRPRPHFVLPQELPTIAPNESPTPSTATPHNFIILLSSPMHSLSHSGKAHPAIKVKCDKITQSGLSFSASSNVR